MEQKIIRRLLKWKKGQKQGPYGIELAPTLRCNLDCLFCWRKGIDKVDFLKEMPLNKYLEIIDQAADLDVKEIKIIGGGEATFRKDIIQIMLNVKEKKMRGYICTNGTLFTEKGILELIKFGWDHIKISLHGPNAETEDLLTGVKGSFRKVVKNLELINYYKRKFRKKKPFIELGVVLVNKNHGHISQFIELAKKYGADALFLEPITAYSKEGEKLKLSSQHKKEFQKEVKKAENLARKYKIRNNLSNFFEDTLVINTGKMEEVLVNKNKTGFDWAPCYEPWYRLGIRVDGLVGPCGFFDESSPENINEKTLKKIWFGPYFEKRRKAMIENKLSAYCRKCCTTLVINNQAIRKELRKR